MQGFHSSGGSSPGRTGTGTPLHRRGPRARVLEEDREADFEYLCIPVAAALARAAASVDRVDPALGDAIRGELMRLALPTEASPLCGLGE
jgi:hypothetical protein